MQTQRLFDGRVVHGRLDRRAVDAGGFVDLSAGAVLLRPGGAFARVPDALQGGYLAVLALSPDAGFAGRHVHERKRETLVVVHGRVEAHLREEASGATTVVPLETWDLLTIEPGVGHALRALTDSVLLELSVDPVDPRDARRVAFP
jgi:mannose-6-phosphate isomerase-like protein (cupin superfamily)